MAKRDPLLLFLRAVAIFLFAAIAVPEAGLRAQDVRPSETALRLPPDVVTEHTLALPDRTLQFNATAGSIPITNSRGDVLAEMGYVAYTLAGAPSGQRPVTFVLNGGPGSSSAWLQIGAIGPWRIEMEKAAERPSAPVHLLPNAEMWLDFTDLVFIDPVGTGYSIIVREGGDKGQDERRRREGREGGSEEGGPSYFWSVSGDIDSIAEFIQKWVNKNDRLTSPKLLVGESYGGFRGPRLARKLFSEHGIALNAVVLLSPVLDFGGRSDRNPPLSFVSILPSLAAAEMERRGEDVSRERLKSVEEYARGDYLEDLMRGPRNSAALDRIVPKVSEITGLPPDAVRRRAGRIDGRAYSEEINGPDGKTASMYDASILGLNPDPTSGRAPFRDPFLTALNAPMTTAMLELYRSKLGYRTDRPYIKLSGEVNRSWIWGNSSGAPESVSQLRDALALDQNLRVLVMHGYTDLVTPYFASELVLDELPAIGEGQRVSSVVYPGGHMFYSRDASRKAMREDALNLVERIIVQANEAKPQATAPAPSIAN